MDHVALLLTGIGALVSAGAAVAMAWLGFRRGSERERRGAAEGAAERLLRPEAVDETAIEAAVKDWFDHHHAKEDLDE